MTDIPEDVYDMARKVAADYIDSRSAGPLTVISVTDLAAFAIMAERERCAGLSDALADGFYRLVADSPRKRKWNETLARNFRAHAEAILRRDR